MSDIKPKFIKNKKFTSLNRSLVLWFLLLSLLPLVLVSWISYQQARDGLTKVASDSLEESSQLSISFIQNWFDYRLMDINNQAELLENTSFLTSLSQGLKNSGKPLNQYVKSYDWAKRVDQYSSSLVTLSRRYDYIYDLFLIDVDGNILYTVANEDDLGTNLITGDYSNSLLSQGFKKTIQSGANVVTDLQRYVPSNNKISGFITAILLDEWGSKIGVVAVQIRFERVFGLLKKAIKENTTLTHYLVGEDGVLRTSIRNNESEIFNRVIDTEQYKLWKEEHTGSAKTISDDNQNENAFYYTGPDGQQVLGIHQLLRLPGVNWVLISEIDENEALAASNWLAKVMFSLVVLTVCVVIVLSVINVRRITRPLILLADASKKFAAGDTDQHVSISASNEIGELADAFNFMLDKRIEFEIEIGKSNLKTARALEQLAEQKSALDEHAIVAITDVKGDITFVNKKFTQISGYSQDELVGSNHRILNSGYHDKDFFRRMYQTISNGFVWHGEVCNRSKDSRLYWVDTTIVPFLDEDGKPKTYIAIRSDITERKESEQALARSEAQARGIFKSVADGIITIDTDGVIVEFNPSAENIFGYSLAEIIGQDVGVLMPKEYYKKHQAGFNKYVSSGQSTIIKSIIVGEGLKKDGSVFPLELSISEVNVNSERRFTALARDITVRKRVEQELLNAKEAAENAFKAKGEFLASMSHEIRTPMNGVLGMLNLLTKTNLDDVQSHRVSIAQSSAQALLGLINDILDFSKVEAGKLELEVIEFNLRGMLGEFAESSGLQAQAKGLELILDVTKIEQAIVKADPGRLRQILNNLVGNAIKFTSEGEVIIRAELNDYDEHQYRLNLEISDTGIGIPNDKLDNLFESFSQVDASTTRKFGGTGLGLSIAKKLSELMGGGVSVTSDIGKGSCFSVNVLLEKSEHEQLVMPDVDISKLHVLIVDDNETNREVLRGQLEHWGAAVDEADSGVAAIAMCESRLQEKEKTLYDIALLDMQMPGMSGEELGKRISEQEKFSSMRLVMMTSMSYRDDLSRLASLGFSAYFPKPATTEDLFGALSVVTTGGEVLDHAAPLVTHDYLQTLIDTKEETVTMWPKNTRVLLVEDNQVNQIVAVSTLEVLGLSADVAGNGLEGLLALQNAPEDAAYTLVLMDCQMPEMDGFEATQKIRQGVAGERYHNLPIIALTANAMKEDRDRCINAGMSDYLAKPFEEKQMKEKLKEWLV